jgi:ribosomal protein S18 acetylase RimI-like enzyme
VHPQYRHQGLGRKVMEHVHQYGQNHYCRMATVATMDFQHARAFYEKLGYVCDFERLGYANGATAVFMYKPLDGHDNHA